MRGSRVVGCSRQRLRVMSISPAPRMPYWSRNASMASWAACPPSTFTSPSKKSSAFACCKYSMTAAWGRMASATSKRASPMAEVILWGTDCESTSAAFFSPNHSCIFSLIQAEALIAAINTAELCGSNKICLNCWISSRIKASRSAPALL